MNPPDTAERRRPLVSLCRGCCCGTSKVPGVDHALQTAELRTALKGAGRLRTVPCLGICEYANVVVVQPSPHGRTLGGRPTWLGFVRDREAVDDLAEWVHAGGPGVAELPAVLALMKVRPPAPKHPRARSV
ncbi:MULTISPECIES: (2Fe-2S) ferredoxin domain-containing protein [unclassified Streptomyces]|uniref:(2Fe-2S) ferredoxin domain-containing protein n=1 Tax=unclassified Streptomyces TaxID=2593676 RepID=UPI002238D82C|nr:(2Fe-2S) ferredoxin domain-containing protein [Streptomyces sp. SHP 1-2]MCW5252933.1 (2Fe-2S) ferredoxin domain-containing protein [Streptomyces sp. SHP 1-2]